MLSAAICVIREVENNFAMSRGRIEESTFDLVIKPTQAVVNATTLAHEKLVAFIGPTKWIAHRNWKRELQ
jgi:hypothetical protein